MALPSFMGALPARMAGYARASFAADAIAGLVTALVLVPQAVAYALLADLPPEAGLYASILPLLAYAALGSSRVLAVGPVALVSLLTATTIAGAGAADPWAAAQLLALMVAAILAVLAVLRAGFLVNFLSEPVIKGFTTGTALLIALSQVPPLLGLESGGGHNVLTAAVGLASALPGLDPATSVLGLAALAVLLAIQIKGAPALQRLGVPVGAAKLISRAGPLAVVVASIAAVGPAGLAAPAGGSVAVLGPITAGPPPLGLPAWDLALMRDMAPGAAAIAVLGYLESVSIGRALAARRREAIAPGRELYALAGANLAAGVSGAYPVAGGFGRSVVNANAGARTQVAAVITAGLVLAVMVALAPALHDLPRSVLAAIILVAVGGLVDLRAPVRLWRLNRPDFLAWAATLGVLLAFGVEAGLLAGAGLSLVYHLARTAKPHYAVVGRVPGTDHFRNVQRHRVETWDHLLLLRIDESLYFANARFLMDTVQAEAAARNGLEAVVLAFPAVNAVDATSIETLDEIEHLLAEAGIALHLAEVKGPVMDQLDRCALAQRLRAAGRLHLSLENAVAALGGDSTNARRVDPATVEA